MTWGVRLELMGFVPLARMISNRRLTKESIIINYETSETIYQDIKGTTLNELFDDLVECAIRYAHIRTDWKFLSIEERIRKDPLRTSTHNVFIDKCNIIAQNMGNNGENNDWRQKLGTNRKQIGDFACYLHCILGISMK